MRFAAALLLAGTTVLLAGDVRAGRASLDPAYKALVIESAPDRAVLVVSDTGEWDAPSVAAAKGGIEAATGIPATHVILAATRPGTPKPAIGKAIEAARAAAANLVPATLSVGAGREDSVSFHRRFLMKDGTVRPDPARGDPEIVQPVGDADPELLWLQVDAAGGGPLAGVATFALSSELAAYPPVMSRVLGKLLGPAAPALITVAPSANLSPADPRSKEAGIAVNRIGTVLAAESLKAWARAKPIEAGRLRMHREVVPRLADGIDAEVQVLSLGGHLAIVALPGDIFSELGVAIRRASPFPHTMVIGLANASIGIVPTAKAFKEGGADVKRARIQPGGGEQLAETALRLLGLAKRESGR